MKRKYRVIQEKEVIVLGGDNIGHCEKENRTNMCLVLNGYRDPAVPIRKHKSSLNVTYLLTYSMDQGPS